MEEMLAANNQRKTYFQVNLLREFGAFTFFMFTALIQLPKAADVGWLFCTGLSSDNILDPPCKSELLPVVNYGLLFKC